MMIRNHSFFAFLLCLTLSFVGISTATAAIKVTTTKDLRVDPTDYRTKVQCSWKGGRIANPEKPEILLENVYYGEAVDRSDITDPLVIEFDSIAEGEAAGYICCGADPDTADGKGYPIYRVNVDEVTKEPIRECSLRKAIKSTTLHTSVKPKANTQLTDYQFDYDLSNSYAVCPDDPRRNSFSRAKPTDAEALARVNDGLATTVEEAISIGGNGLYDKTIFPYKANIPPILDCDEVAGVNHEIHLKAGSKYLLTNGALEVTSALRVLDVNYRYISRSSSDFTLGVAGEIDIESGRLYEKGQSITIVHDLENYQKSKIVSYDSQTGALSFESPSFTAGAGSPYSKWEVSLDNAEISAGMNSRVFEVQAGSLVLENVNLSNGDAKGGDGGLVLLGLSANGSGGGNTYLIAENVEFSNGKAKNGGLIYLSAGASAELESVTLIEGYATGKGGAIYTGTSAKKLIIKGFNIENNTAGTDSGAVFANALESLSLQQGSVIRNTTTISGTGGISIEASAANIDFSNITFSKNIAATLNLDQSTFNSATPGVGALFVKGADADDRFNNLTIMENEGGTFTNTDDANVPQATKPETGGVKITGSSGVVLANSVIANNTSTGTGIGDCNLSGISDIDGHHNLVPSSGGCLYSNAYDDSDIPWNQSDIKQQFSPLTPFNLGFVGTYGYVPLSSGLAVDNGTNNLGTITCLITDQRRESRENTACDIGAIEYQVAVGKKNSFYYRYADDQIVGNCAPVLRPDGLLLDVACNDFMVDKKMVHGKGGPLCFEGCIEIVWVGDGRHGTIMADNSDPEREKLVYTAPVDFHGEDRFRYKYYVEGEESLDKEPVSAEVMVIIQPPVVGCHAGNPDEPSNCVKSAIEEYIGVMSLWTYAVVFLLFLVRARRRIFIAMAPVIVLLAANVVQAAEIVVTTESVAIDSADGLCSLPEAVAASRDGGVNFDPAACADGALGKDVIVFDQKLYNGIYDVGVDLKESDEDQDGKSAGYLKVTIDLASEGTPIVLKNYNPLTIKGRIGKTKISSNGARIFKVYSSLTLNELELSGGSAGDQQGGLIEITRGSLTLEKSKLSNGTANSGGAIYAAAGATSLKIRDSHFEENHSAGDEYGEGGGVIAISSAVVNFDFAIERSSFVDNTSITGASVLDLNGGIRAAGIGGQYQSGIISSSTFTGNYSEKSGAIDLSGLTNPSGFIINNITIVGNTTEAGDAAGLVFSEGFQLYNSFVSNNTNLQGELNCSSVNLFKTEYNLLGQNNDSGGCQYVDSSASIANPGSDVLLDASWETQIEELDEDPNHEYGFTQYFKPTELALSKLKGKGSPLISDSYSTKKASSCTLFDQLGNSRVSAKSCDIGSVQLVEPTAFRDALAVNNALYGRVTYQKVLNNDVVDKRAKQIISLGLQSDIGLQLASSEYGDFSSEINLDILDDKTDLNVNFTADIQMACDALSDIEHSVENEGGFGVPYPGICLKDISVDIINDNQIILYDQLNQDKKIQFSNLTLGSWVILEIDYLGVPKTYSLQIIGVGDSDALKESQKDELSLTDLKESYQFLEVYPDFSEEMKGAIITSIDEPLLRVRPTDCTEFLASENIQKINVWYQFAYSEDGLSQRPVSYSASVGVDSSIENIKPVVRNDLIRITKQGINTINIDVLANDRDIDSSQSAENYTENCKIGDKNSTTASLKARSERLKKQSAGLLKSTLTLSLGDKEGSLAKRDIHYGLVVAHTNSDEGLVNSLKNFLFERSPKADNDLFQNYIYSVVVVAIPPSLDEIKVGERVDVLESISGHTYSFTRGVNVAGYQSVVALFGTKYPLTAECKLASSAAIEEQMASDRKQELDETQYFIPVELQDLASLKYLIPEVCKTVAVDESDILMVKMHREFLLDDYEKLSSDDESGFFVYALVNNLKKTHWVVLMRNPEVSYDEVVRLLSTKSMVPVSGNVGVLKPLAEDNVGILVDRDTGMITYIPRNVTHAFDDYFSYTVEDVDGAKSNRARVDIVYDIEQRAASLYGYGLLAMMLILFYRQRRSAGKV